MIEMNIKQFMAATRQYLFEQATVEGRLAANSVGRQIQ